MRFLGSKFTQNALATGAKALPQTLCRFQGHFAAGERERRGKREERKRKRGIGERKEGRKGREEGRDGKGKKEGKRWEGEFASLALGGIDAHELDHNYYTTAIVYDFATRNTQK